MDLAQILEKAYEEYHSVSHREKDPIKVVHQYTRPEDQEIIGFLTALLSYGSVPTILASVQRAVQPLGNSPQAFIKKQSLEGLWAGFYHRFTRGEDIEILLNWVKSALEKHSSLENYFLASEPKSNMKELLSSFVRRLMNEPLPPHLKKVAKQRERNLKYLLSDPERGSACKRLNMFLRWMIRPDDGIDLGLWKKIPTKNLILPIDTHLLKTLHKLKWTKSQNASWKVAEEATEKLKKFCPEDPVRYDFALCHLSMSGSSI
jgi:uncharacterized protein (TIGR02757 family)